MSTKTRRKPFDKMLSKVYYDLQSSGGFGGVKRIALSTGKSTKLMIEWLTYQDTYTLHKPVRSRFPRRRTIVTGIIDQYQCDLIDMQKMKKDNDGYNFILTCIDVFSKMGYARLLKNKTRHA